MKKLALVLVLLCMTVVSKAAFAWEYTRPAGNMASIRAGYLYSCDEEAIHTRTQTDPGFPPVVYTSVDSFDCQSTGYSVGITYDLFLFNFIAIGIGCDHMWMNTDVHYLDLYKGKTGTAGDQNLTISRKTVTPSLSLRILLPFNIYAGGIVSGRYQYASDPISYSYTYPGPSGLTEYTHEFSLKNRIDVWGYATAGVLVPVVESVYIDISGSYGKRFTDYQWAKIEEDLVASSAAGTRVTEDTLNLGNPQKNVTAEMSGTNDLSFRIGVVYDFGA